jgi:hypothetical protein
MLILAYFRIFYERRYARAGCFLFAKFMHILSEEDFYYAFEENALRRRISLSLFIKQSGRKLSLKKREPNLSLGC